MLAHNWLLAVVLAACPARSFADAGASAKPDPHAENEARPPSEAVDHYLRGRQWYLAGRYRDALVELKAALELDPNSADLLYNVARVYENLRLFDEAIAYYQRYLERLPQANPEERDKTDKTIRRLQGAKLEFEQQQRREQEQAAQNVEPRHSVRRADLAFWLTGGAAAALLAAGGVTGVLALKKTDDVGSFVVGPDGTLMQRQHMVQQADQLALATDVMLGAGAAALTGAILLFLLRDPDPDAQPDSPHSQAQSARARRTHPSEPPLSVGLDGLHWRVAF